MSDCAKVFLDVALGLSLLTVGLGLGLELWLGSVSLYDLECNNLLPTMLVLYNASCLLVTTCGTAGPPLRNEEVGEWANRTLRWPFLGS